MKKVFTIFIFQFGIISFADAQYYYDKLYSISLDFNQPLSNTDFLDELSAAGGRGSINKFVSEKISAGLDINWNKYTQHEPRQTYTSSNGAITAEYFKYVIIYGATLRVAYYLKPTKKFSPFFAMGVGGSNVDYTVYYNIYSDGANGWGFLARPEAGALLRLGENSSWGVQAAVHYDLNTSKSDLFGYSNFSSIGVTLGIVSLDW
jgi:hypothetical protein